MTLLHRVMSVLRRLLRSQRAEQELDADIQGYLDASSAEKMRDGIPPAEARRLAMLELGGAEQVKERVRTDRHGAQLEALGRDFRYACRILRRNPMFNAVIVLTLTLGIAANTAIFGLIDALMLRWLPVRDPQNLIQVTIGEEAGGVNPNLSYAIAGALAEQRDIFAGAAGFNTAVFDVGPAGSVQKTPGAVVTGGYYETLGLNPAAGRLIVPSDDRPGARPVAVISHGYWTRQFAERADITGQTILLNGVPVEIVGVSPRGFVGADVGSIADVTVPVATLPQVDPPAAPLLGPGNFWLRVLARPKAGLSMREAERRFAAVWPRIAEPLIAPHWPASRRAALVAATFRFSPGGTGWTTLRERYATPLNVLLGAAGVVLLVACVNVAGLLIARGSVRQREIAVRLAIGAGRTRIVRQLLVEGVLLSSISAALALAVSLLLSRFLVKMISDGPVPIVFDLSPNWHVLGFTVAAALVTAGFFSVAPALQSAAVAPFPALKNDSRGSRRSSRLLPWLVSAQVSLSFVLLVGAVLLGRTLHNLRSLDSGFNAHDVLLIDVPDAVAAASRDLVDKTQRVPGVLSAGISTHTPLSGSTWSEPVVPAGQPVPDLDTALFVGAGTRFFETLEIPVLSGRSFTDDDSPQSPAVAIVNARYAHKFLGSENPIGRHLSASVRGQKKDLEIVGLVADVFATGLRSAAPPTVYVPYAQLRPGLSAIIEIRTEGATDQVATAVRQALQAAIPGTPIEIRSFAAQVEATLLGERLMAFLSQSFAGLALGLACIGLYGLLAFTVARRIKEIGIRLALGATPRGLTAKVLNDATRLVLIGIVCGFPVAWMGSRWIESLLFGLQPRDPAAVVSAIVPLAAAALFAAFIPARRAARVDPLVALRHE
jgi:putative ABC transport system permease protein